MKVVIVSCGISVRLPGLLLHTLPTLTCPCSMSCGLQARDKYQGRGVVGVRRGEERTQ
jgi:hypothetical protein